MAIHSNRQILYMYLQIGMNNLYSFYNFVHTANKLCTYCKRNNPQAIFKFPIFLALVPILLQLLHPMELLCVLSTIASMPLQIIKGGKKKSRI